MISIKINKEQFKFNYLADYATYLLNNFLRDFVLVGIRFCKEVDLPLLKPLSKFSEEELVNLSLESNREILEALAGNRIAELIEANTQKWIANTLGIIDREEVAAEDLTLAFYIRRKTFAYFLDAYTKNVVLQKFIIAEVDTYSTQEELISLNVYLEMQKEKLHNMNEKLMHHKDLLIEAQAFGGIGSYLTDFKNTANSFYSPEYKKILGIEDHDTYDEFLECIHPEDRIKFKKEVEETLRTGGELELEYRYKKNNTEKLIWTKGKVVSENGKPVIIRGTIRDITGQS